jgi:hypothetical protein
MIKVKAVIDTIRSQDLLTPEDLEAFLECPANMELCGFPEDMDVPEFTHLYELLDENWIGERVIDARAYQVMGDVNCRDDCPYLLILPSIFHTQLTNAYREGCLSKALKDLRDSLLADLPDTIAFVFNKNGSHWAPCVVRMHDFIIQQGDSLRWDKDDDMFAKLQWFLSDVTEAQGTWTEEYLFTPYQGDGSGSCAIIALNAIQTSVDWHEPTWSSASAAEFRHKWLRELVIHHLVSMRSVSSH